MREELEAFDYEGRFRHPVYCQLSNRQSAPLSFLPHIYATMQEHPYLAAEVEQEVET